MLSRSLVARLEALEALEESEAAGPPIYFVWWRDDDPQRYAICGRGAVDLDTFSQAIDAAGQRAEIITVTRLPAGMRQAGEYVDAA